MSSRITVSAMSALECFIAFAGQQTAFSAQCVKRSAACGLLLGAKLDGKYAGYLCAAAESGIIRILYGYTIPDFRKRGIFDALMRFAAKDSEKAVRVSIPENHEYRVPVVKTCLKQGFQKAESVHVFTCHKDMYPAWDDFMTIKGARLCSYLERRGYRAVSLAQAGEDIIRQLRESPCSEYKNVLNPGMFLDIPENYLSREMSYAAVKEGRLAGYVLVTHNSPEKAVFEHISESAREQGTGLILLPFAAAMKTVFTGSTVRTISYAMYESNVRANTFRESVLSRLNPSVAVSENYYYLRKREQEQRNQK